jgi:UDP-2,3-diacylglucosamine pyrophosphatase LpxH
MKNHYKTIVISDVHLGTEGSKAKELVKFLKVNTCDKLILNGDIIDGWQLKKYGKWKKHHSRFFKRVIQMIDTHNTEVIYLRGNHDDFLDHIIPFRMGNISIQRDYVYTSLGRKYYIVHGDVFDSVTTNLKWVAKLGDVGYTFLLWVNQRYNNYRLKRGLPYYSLSQVVKAKVKSAVLYIDDFEKQLVCLADIRKCDGIICGHIHQPALKRIRGIEYMNSGDWVETLSALVETVKGKWEIVYYNEALMEEEPVEEDGEESNSFESDIISLKEALTRQKSAS